MQIADNDSADVLIIPNDDSTSVIETPDQIVVGEGDVDSAGTNTLDGDFNFTTGGQLDPDTFRITGVEFVKMDPLQKFSCLSCRRNGVARNGLSQVNPSRLIISSMCIRSAAFLASSWRDFSI